MATYNIDYNIYMDNGVLKRWDNNQKAYVEITDSNITDHLYYSNGHWVMTGLDITISKATAITVMNGDATISVIGTNSITASPVTSDLSTSGIASSDSNVTLQGSGELSITAGDVQNHDSIGIWMSGTLTLKESVTVTAKGGNSLSRYSYGVQVTQLSVSDTASLTATAGSGATEAAYMLTNYPSSSAPTDAVTSTDLALNPVTFDTNKKTYVDEVGNAITSLTIQAYDDRVVVTPATGTKENPQDLGADKTITVKSGTANGGALEVQEGAYASGSNLIYASNDVTGEDAKGGAIYNAGYLSLNTAAFSGNSATDSTSGAVYNTGKLLMSGDITLSTSSDTVYNEGLLIWNFSSDNSAKFNNYEYVTSAVSEEGRPVGFQGIWVDAAETTGTFVIATGNMEADYAANPYKYAFAISTDGENFAGLVIGNKVYFNDRYYTLAFDADKTELALTVEEGTAPGQRLVVESETVIIEEDKTYDFTNQPYYAGNGGIIEVRADGEYKNTQNVTLEFINGKSTGSTTGGDSYKTAAAGGAIYNAGTVNLKNVTFTNNIAVGYHSGSAIFSTGTLTLDNATFNKNHTDRDGALCVYGGTAEVTNSTFSENTADYSGGAVRLQAGTLNMSDVTFTNNKVSYMEGGAISFYDGTAVIDNAVFTGNTANDGGGAVFVATNVTIKNSTFKGNKAAKGGAIVNGYNSEGRAVLYLDDVTFGGSSAEDNNTATSGYGNAIYNIAKNTIHLQGDVNLMSSNETIYLESGSVLDWVISDTDDKNGYVSDYSLITGTKSAATLTIDAGDAEKSSYILAGNASSAVGQEFTITIADGTSKAITVGGDTVTDKYGINQYTLAVDDNNDLILSVVKPTITITANSAAKMYDGEALTDDGYTVIQDELVAGHEVSATVTGTITKVGTEDNVVSDYKVVTASGEDVTNYYNVITVNGTLEVTANNTLVNLRANSAGKMYDGTELTDFGYTWDGLATGDAFTGVVIKGGQTHAGLSANGITSYKVTNAAGEDVTFCYSNIQVQDGVLEVTKRDVTITSGSAEKVYDGTALTNDTITVSGSGFVGTEGATYDVTGSQTKAGSSANTFTCELNDGTIASDYAITQKEGTLTVFPNNTLITITADSNSRMYDGTELKDNGYTVTGALAAGDTLVDVVVSGSQTDAGISANMITSYKVVNAAGEDVTSCYGNIKTQNGTLEITKRDVTLTSATDSKVYDGTALTNSTVTVSGSGWADNEGATYNVTGSQTEIGISANTFSYTLNANTKAANYDIRVNEGTLGVVASGTVITITADSSTRMYDGKALTDSGYTVTGNLVAGDTLVDVVVTGTITNVGVANNTVSSYRIVNAKGEDVTYSYNNIQTATGILEITQRDVILTSGSAVKAYDGTPLTNSTVTVSGSGWADGEGATYDVTGSQTDVGVSDNTFSYTLNDGTLASNYAVTTVEGTLEVVKSDSLITITADSASKMYDGTALSDDGYTCTGSLAGGDYFASVTVEGTITDAGTVANTVTGWVIMNAAGEDVTGFYTNIQTADGTLTVTKRDVTLTSATDKKRYDGTALTNDTVTVSGSGWVEGEGAIYDVTGSQTEIGSSANTFTYVMSEGTKASNYAVTTEEGTLTVISNAIIDYNASGKSDMIQFVDGLVYVTHDTENGYVQTPAINDVTGWDVTEFRRDITGDGLADVQITSDDGYGSTWVAVLRNDYLQDGTITLNYQFIGAYNNLLWQYVGSADFNGDGKAEVLMQQTQLGSDNGLRHVAAWVTDETGTWVDNEWLGCLGANEWVGYQGDWDIAGTADIDGNGTDNVILRRADGMIGFWRETGTNVLEEIQNAGLNVLINTGDFDGDHADDFLFTNLSGDYITWSNIGGELTEVTIGNIDDLGGDWDLAGAGDYNGDGKDELLWCDGVNVAYSEANQENFSKLIQIA